MFSWIHFSYFLTAASFSINAAVASHDFDISFLYDGATSCLQHLVFDSLKSKAAGKEKRRITAVVLAKSTNKNQSNTTISNNNDSNIMTKCEMKMK